MAIIHVTIAGPMVSASQLARIFADALSGYNYQPLFGDSVTEDLEILAETQNICLINIHETEAH